MSQRRNVQRRQQARRASIVPWAIGGVIAVVLIAGAAGWLSSSDSGASPISRLSTDDFHSLAFSPTDPAAVFFGHHGGVMVSEDGGRSWQPTSLQNADAMALAVPPANPQIMYAAGHDVFVKSIDGGETWQAVTNNLPGTDVHGFAVDPQNADHLFANVVGAGLWSSQDGGSTWQPLSSDAPRSTVNLAIGASAQTLYAAAGQAGLWRSEDGGQTWSALSRVPGDGVVAAAYAPGQLNVTTVGDGAGLHVSTDGGSTWSALGLTGTLMAFAVSPLDPGHLVVVDDSGRVYASRDGGATWSDQ